MKRFAYTLTAVSAVAAALLTGCGSGSSDDSSAATDITVERGPLLYATVTDASGQQATMQGFGVYRFENTPAYPVTSQGGIIDVNRNNVIDEGDLIATGLKLQTMQGDAATIVTSLAQSTEIKTMLQQDFNLSEAQMFSQTPSTNNTIAAVSDEVYKYCIENNISDPAQLTLQTFQSLQDQIEARLRTYQSDNLSASERERALVQNELNQQGMTQSQADAMEAQMQNGAGQNSSSAYGQPETAGTCSSCLSSSAQNSSQAAQAGNPSAGGQPETAGTCSSSCSSSSQSSMIGTSELTEAQKYTLAYMWNEEKLAKDIYLALNDVWPNQVLYNIATKSETQHEASVEALVEAYDINITNLVDYTESYSEAELRAFGPGEYGIAAVRELYDTLYAKGVQSAQDALEVGCLVEVTDINDLNRDIETASGADDLVAVFENLRSGSYNHYWAFNDALKAIGVSDGCCVLGDDFCKTADEYPDTRGGGH